MTLWDSLAADDADDAPLHTDVPTTWSVAELGAAIGSSLKSSFPGEVWVSGEIRSIRPPNRNGHQYFDLIEPGADPGAYPDAKISVSLFRQSRNHVVEVLRGAPGEADLAEGLQVRIRARVDWWVAGGQLRLVMSDIDPVFTLGQLDARRRALLERLAADGLLDANAKLVVPPVPLRIGLVTSAGSAAHADFMDELRTSRYRFDVVLADARVQGADAPRTLVAGIAKVAAAGVDVIAVIRGGGSRTDLVAFDHADVAYAIAGAPVPVFTGIGHEIDRSVADDVAHHAFKTPTAVAQHLVGRVADAETALVERSRRLAHLTDRHIRAATTLLDDRLRRVARAAAVADTRAATHLAALGRQLVAGAERRIRDADTARTRRQDRLGHAAPRHLRRATERLDGLDARLGAADPARLFARGWSLTRTGDGGLVRSVEDVSAHDTIVTTVADGTVTGTVRTTEPRQEQR